MQIARRINFPDDTTLIRWVFYIMLGVCVIVLLIDARDLASTDPLLKRVRNNPIPPAIRVPVLQPLQNDDATRPYSPRVTASPNTLRKPLSINLLGENRLELTGSIDQGSTDRFAERAEKISEYVDTIVLNSPGGSVADALAISNLIREKGWNTHVASGKLCASSCPIIFAGGVGRSAEDGAAIGVHQIFSGGEDTRTLDQAISGTQSSTADIVRHLEEMGADPALWTHALETPPANLYYFRPEELLKYRLVTPIED